MEIKVINRTYYHVTPYNILGKKLYPNEQGLHLSETIKGSELVMKDRGIINYNLYHTRLPFIPNPLQIDFDLAYWSASEIAACLLASIDGLIQPETKFSSKRITKEDVHIDNLQEEDTPFLYKLLKNETNSCNNFYSIMDFLKEKGYNCIRYPLIESKNTQYSIIVNNPIDIYLMGKNKVKECYYTGAQKMIENYNDYYSIRY